MPQKVYFSKRLQLYNLLGKSAGTKPMPTQYEQSLSFPKLYIHRQYTKEAQLFENGNNVVKLNWKSLPVFRDKKDAWIGDPTPV